MAENLTEFTSADVIAADLIGMRWREIQREKRKKEEEEEEQRERKREEVLEIE